MFQITKKTIGTSNPEVKNIAYDSGLRVSSILDDQGRGTRSAYEFQTQTKLFYKYETHTSGWKRTITNNADYGLSQLELNGRIIERTQQKCEDSLELDEHNRGTFYDRDRYSNSVSRRGNTGAIYQGRTIRLVG